MTDNQNLRGVWAVLKEIKQELKDVDNKWEKHIQDAAADRNQLQHIASKLDNIEKTLILGNGQEPLVTQVRGLKTEVDHLKDLTGTSETVEERKNLEVAARKARWVAIAKIVGLVSLAIPGILALLGVGGG